MSKEEKPQRRRQSPELEEFRQAQEREANTAFKRVAEALINTIDERIAHDQRQQTTTAPVSRRRRFRSDSVERVAKELWPSTDGKAPEGLSTPDALRKLGDELEHRGIPASPDTQRRVIGRR
jgi:hypothetical protein